MSPLKQSNNFAARMGRWSARHRKAAVLGWLAFVLLAMGIGLGAGMTMLEPSDSLTGESAQAQRIVDGAGLPARAHESVLVQSRRYRVTQRVDAEGRQREDDEGAGRADGGDERTAEDRCEHRVP